MREIEQNIIKVILSGPNRHAERSKYIHVNRYGSTKYTRAQRLISLFLFCLQPHLPVFTETTFTSSHCACSGFLLFTSFTLPCSLINEQLKNPL